MTAITFKWAGNDTLTAETLGHHYTIKRGVDWEKREQFTVYRRHVSARAYRNSFPAGRRFATLQAVEQHYKPLRGLTVAFTEAPHMRMITRVVETLRYCLLSQAESSNGIPADAVIVDCISYRAAFNAQRLEEKRADIIELRGRLLPTFFQPGGESFSQMCWTRDLEQWSVPNCEHLLALIIGAKLGHLEPADRTLWPTMAGKVPHIVLTDPGVSRAT